MKKILFALLVAFVLASCGGTKYGCKPERPYRAVKFKGFL